MTRLVIDPVTRVGGQLRVEVEVANGKVVDAWASGTMYRGVERIIEGRDPRDAWLFAQRICGTCGTSHALASVRAVEDALGIVIPRNARLIRNILQGAQLVVDAAAGFYQREAPDWVDAASAIGADPAAAAALAQAEGRADGSATQASFAAARDRLASLLDPAGLGPFANAYWEHPAYRLPPESNLLVMSHYLEALDWRRRVMRMQTLLGGKSPHPQSFLVGGMSLAPEWGGPRRPSSGEHPWQVERNAPTALSAAGLVAVGDLVREAADFVEQAYVPDVLMLARHYPDWAGMGTGIGNYLAFGDFPTAEGAEAPLALARGRVMGRDLSAVVAVDATGVAESIAHAHYSSETGAKGLVNPATDTTTPAYGGPLPPFRSLEGVERYSWIKAPRYEDDPMEAGPLSRILVGYAAGSPEVLATLDGLRRTGGSGTAELQGTLGRTLARALEARIVAGRLRPWLDELKANLGSGDLAVVDVTMWDPGSWPSHAEGLALGESPRGAVGHWVRIDGGRVSHYQVVDASTWNVSPRDARGRRGAMEEALVGTPIVNPREPVEILRTIHSFAPCPTCAAH